jgi:hypothetical protein
MFFLFRFFYISFSRFYFCFFILFLLLVSNGVVYRGVSEYLLHFLFSSLGVTLLHTPPPCVGLDWYLAIVVLLTF